MKRFQTSALVFCYFLALLTATAQQSPPGQPPIASAAVPPQSFIENIRKTVAFLEVDYQKVPDLKGVVGTCFFVMVLDKRLGDNRGFVYLVTNRHVAQPGIDLGTPQPALQAFIRLNLVKPQGASKSVREFIPAGQLHWFFPKDEAVDLAVMPAAPDQTKYSYMTVPYAMITTSDQVKAGDVGIGDRVVFAGYFSNFPGQQRIEPIVREGVVAMLPEEPMDTTLHKPGQLYLADLHAFHGNSGSPVFVNLGGEHHGSFMLGDNYRLLGLISGYYPESAGYSVPAATVLTGEVHDNSGIATIVPAEEIIKLLNSSEVLADQDRQLARLSKKP